MADTYTKGLYAGGLVNLPAAVIAMLVTCLLIIGTRESATVNAVLVSIKVVALIVFVILAIPVIDGSNFEPFAPNGFLDTSGIGIGVAGAAASIFFAYVGFDAVATAAIFHRAWLPIGASVSDSCLLLLRLRLWTWRCHTHCVPRFAGRVNVCWPVVCAIRIFGVPPLYVLRCLDISDTRIFLRRIGAVTRGYVLRQ